MKAPSVSTALRRHLYLNRRALATVCTFVAVLACLTALVPPRPDGVPVVVAARDLPVGTVLAASDLTTVHLAREATPDGAAASASGLVGRTLGAPLTRHSPVTSASVSSGERQARPGFVVVPLPLREEVAPLARPGTVLALFDGAGELVADEVRVLSAPEAPGGLGLSSASHAVLIEVEPRVATRLATASQTGQLTVALR